MQRNVHEEPDIASSRGIQPTMPYTAKWLALHRIRWCLNQLGNAKWTRTDFIDVRKPGTSKWTDYSLTSLGVVQLQLALFVQDQTRLHPSQAPHKLGPWYKSSKEARTTHPLPCPCPAEACSIAKLSLQLNRKGRPEITALSVTSKVMAGSNHHLKWQSPCAAHPGACSWIPTEARRSIDRTQPRFQSLGF